MSRRLSALGVAAGVATILAAPPAFATVNLEDWQVYEEAYLALCKRDHTERACSCSMVALEKRVGFVDFAEEVNEHREAFLERSPLAAAALDLIGACSAVGKLQ